MMAAPEALMRKKAFASLKKASTLNFFFSICGDISFSLLLNVGHIFAKSAESIKL
jgi:hypothetical protein